MFTFLKIYFIAYCAKEVDFARLGDVGRKSQFYNYFSSGKNNYYLKVKNVNACHVN